MLVRDRVSRIYFLKKFFKYPVSMSVETFKNMGFKNTMRAGFGYLWSCVHKLPEDNLANFYINRFGKPLYEMFFEDYTTKLWGVDPKELSADWGAQRVKGLSLWKAVADAVGRLVPGVLGDDICACKIVSGDSFVAKSLEKGVDMVVTSRPKKIDTIM